MRKATIIQSAKLYLQKEGERKIRHIVNWPTFLKICEDLKLSTDWKDRVFLDDEHFPPIGKPITEWPEKEPSPSPSPYVSIRKMAILGTCLPNTPIEHMKNLGFTHFYGNRTWWPNYDEVEQHGLKVFYNIRIDGEMTEAYVKKEVQQYKNRKFVGGWWSDQLGHEPDYVGQPLEKRIWFYNTVRKYDPDKQNHPVMEMMNNTSFYDFSDRKYPGWENAFSDKTHDLLLFDCYPGMDEDAIKNMENTWNKFIKVFPHKHQVIPQMQAYAYKKGGIWRQYIYWKAKMSSDEFDNPYCGKIGVCWYNDQAVRQDGEMQQEIKEVNMDAMK
jgi:hypothetical protein